MSVGEELVQVRLQAGRYEGLLTAPKCDGVEAVHNGKVIAAADVVQDVSQADRFRVGVDLPVSVLSDGVQVVALRSVQSGHVLGRITLMAGDALDEDIRAELALVRDELEMLKRAFRRHVSEMSTS